jgi:hypothetical protein
VDRVVSTDMRCLTPFAVAVAAVVAATLSPPALAAPPAVIRVVSITTSYTTVDVPPKKASAGDHDVFTSRLLNARAQFGKPRGAVVGSDRGTMLLTSATSARLMTVARLPGGTIVVSGPLTSAGGGAVSIPVVEGTGQFAGARGTVTILAPKDPKTAINIYRLTYGPIA